MFLEENVVPIPGYSNYGFNDSAFVVWKNAGSIVDGLGAFHFSGRGNESGQSNAVFLDGHGEAVRYTEPDWSPAPRVGPGNFSNAQRLTPDHIPR